MTDTTTIYRQDPRHEEHAKRETFSFRTRNHAFTAAGKTTAPTNTAIAVDKSRPAANKTDDDPTD